ncbi:MAG: TlyA family RNA methyltransferase [Hyphomonadaceae bacterium]|nr:TlyA family RNA methyltransferase [Hyphomonadaceae bacterium]
MDKQDRADKVLVALGHFQSRASAQAAIDAGRVTVSGRVLTKASEKISATAKIEAAPAHPWVSRAGLKLAAALLEFDIDPRGAHCLDIGASTGGFTEVLLENGASSVVAVDVGRDQLHARLRADPRVISLEATDARGLTQDQVGTPQILVCDASFISLNKLLGTPLSFAAQNADLIALFKPQFEVGREYVGKGGIVTDTAATERAEDTFCDWLSNQGWSVHARANSPIKGGDGNAERLIYAVKA